MILDFSADDGTKYSLKCINQSATSWYFYIYQRLSNQSGAGIYSLVWMLSPYKIGLQSFTTFTWSVDYSCHWLDTGLLQPGVIPFAGGSVAASLSTSNCSTFDMQNDTPQLSTPVPVSPSDQFLIVQGANIPNSIFSTGIGMSGFATFVQQSYANTTQNFGVNTTYWVAASQQVQAMQVLSQNSISSSISFTFPANSFSLTATLAEDNTWTVH